MAVKTEHHPYPFYVYFCFLLLILQLAGGCAKKPWTNDLGEDQGKEAKKVFAAMQQRDAVCSSCLDGDAIISLENHLDTRVLSGYIKFMLPDSVKFIAANPLGQPLFAVATDGVKFESLDAPGRKYMAGSLKSYALLHDIPPAFLAGSWAEWLSGRIDKGTKEALELQEDGASRGIWFSFRHKVDGQDTMSRLLIDIQGARLLSRILEDAKGNILAEISYTDWQKMGECQQPGQIRMSRLSFGGELNLKLSALESSSVCREHDFILPVPAGFERQFLPY